MRQRGVAKTPRFVAPRRSHRLPCRDARLSAAGTAADQASAGSVAGCCFYHDHTGHVRMQRAEIVVAARRGKGEEEKLLSVSSTFDLNCLATAAILCCGMWSLLVQVTVVPAFTVSFCGFEGEIVDRHGGCRALRPAGPGGRGEHRAVVAPSAAAMAALARVLRSDMVHLNPQRRVDDREPLFTLLEGDRRDAEDAAQLVVRDLHRAGGGAGAARLGNAVKRAVWKVTLPSIFCITWWM